MTKSQLTECQSYTCKFTPSEEIKPGLMRSESVYVANICGDLDSALYLGIYLKEVSISGVLNSNCQVSNSAELKRVKKA